MYFVYILRLADNSYYIGSCNSIENRFNNHQKGRVKSTKSKLPAEIIHTEEFKSRSDSCKRELQIKKWKSRKAIERLIIKNRDGGPFV